jgi:tripartite-type tricarboxylate transporter receptor subunit TctC
VNLLIRRLAAAPLIALLAVLATAPAQGQQESFPARPVRLVVPYAPGGMTDGIGRAMAEGLSKRLGQPVIVENRPGAGTMVGAQAVSSAAPDGYTLLLATSTTLGSSPFLYADRERKLDPLNSFTHVGLVSTNPFILVANGETNLKSVRELLARQKASGQPLNYGSAGNGTPHHLAMELFGQQAGLKLLHVPYRGSAPALSDLLAGQFPVMITDLTPALPHIRSGRLVALAVADGTRTPLLPEVPTFKEAGVEGVDLVAWQGIVAPPGLPTPVLGRLNAEIGAVVASTDFKARCFAMGCTAVPSQLQPRQFTEYVRKDLPRWEALVRASGAKPD